MGISYSEVTHHKAKNTDFSNSSVNGSGGIGNKIVNDSIDTVFREITATERENGITHRVKMFVSNESTDRTMKDTLIAIAQDIIPPDKFRLFPATEKEYLSFVLDQDINGGGSPVAAGTTFSIKNILPAGKTSSDLVGRRVKHGDYSYTIDSAASGTQITFSDSVAQNIAAGEVFEMDDIFDSVEDDESFVEENAIINAVSSTTFQAGASNINIPVIEKDYFHAGQKVLVMDGYFRPVFRATIDEVVDHASDNSIAVVKFDKTYTGTTVIPSGEGFLTGSIEKTIKPGETVSYWAELIISPESAVDSDSVKQFQVITYFDDVKA